MNEQIKAEGLKEVQLYLLDQFVKVCEKHNIHYWLEGGSALGAYRHSGFIPWDDDIDIGIFYDDYHFLIKKLKEELPNDIFVQDGTTDNFPKIGYATKLRYKNSRIVEKGFTDNKYVQTHNINQGIFIDIFPFSQVPFKLSPFFSNLVFRVLAVYNDIQFETFTGKKRRIAKIMRRFLPLPIVLLCLKGYRKLGKLLNKNLYAIDVQYFIQKDFYKKEWLIPTKKLLFENKPYNVPANITEYLTEHYGSNYMTVPPIEEQNRAKHIISYEIFSKN